MADPPKQRRPPTVADVARRARVSRATVSRVLNQYAHVRPEVRARVQRAMHALGYRPDAVARSLARRETRTLGLVVADITNPFYAETARAVLETAKASGYHVILCNTDNQPRVQEEYVEVLRQRRVDGIVFGSVFLDDPVVEALVASDYPCLMYNRRLRSRRGNFIVLDNLRASRDVTRHLVALGHRRIGFVSGLPNISTAAERLQGYREALRASGLPADRDLIRPGAFQAGTAQEAARDLLKRRGRPTAIVASNDLMALGVIQAAAELDVRIPDDLAVVGFDDIEIADHPRVQLTTMAQQKAEMGRLAALGILEVIRHGAGAAGRPLQQILDPMLIIRRTCGALLRAQGRRRPGQGHAAPI